MQRCFTLTIVIFFVYLLLITINAQAPDTLWTKTFGGSNNDWGNYVHLTSDGGYIITGYTSSFGAGDTDVWLVKTDAYGDTIWSKTFGGSGVEWGSSVQQTSDSGYVVIGTTFSYGAGERDIWLIKTDAFGDTLWTKTYGGESIDLGSYIQQTNDGGFVITGSTSSFGKGFTNAWLIKIDALGDTLWTKTFGDSSTTNSGYSVQQTSDSGYVVTGCKSIAGISTHDIWLIKTDAVGDTCWTKTFGGGFSDDCGTGIQQTSDGGYIIAGNMDFLVSDFYLWLIKTDSLGDTLWTKTFSVSHPHSGAFVQQTRDGGYVIAETKFFSGMSNSDVWLIKTNASGDTLWTKTFGGNDIDYGNCVQQTDDDGYIVTGTTNSYGAGGSDIWLLKVSPDPSTIFTDTPTIISSDFILKQNYPNPFNPSTKIKFTLPKFNRIRIEVLNLLGQKVVTILNKQMLAGTHQVEFDAHDLPSGVYLYRIKAGEYQEVKKMIFLR